MESQNNGRPSIVDAYIKENQNEALRQVELQPSQINPSSLDSRILAFIVDYFILAILNLLIFNQWESLKVSNYFQKTFLSFSVTMLIKFVYAGFFYSSHYSATPGKIIAGIKVVHISGKKLDFWQAGLRDSLGKFVSFLPFGVGYLFAFFRSDRRAVHDLLFKTIVIHK